MMPDTPIASPKANACDFRAAASSSTSERREATTQSIVEKLVCALGGTDAERQVVASGPALDEASSDFGRVARGRPQVVVTARTTRDVRDVIRVANDLRVRVTPRGNGGNTQGQTVADGGIVLDLRRLSTMDLSGVDGDGRHVATLGAGVTWASAIDAIRRRGRSRNYPSLQIPVVPGYKNLTVGGTLSIGGGGFRSHTRGLQVDHVTELEIVTAAGEILIASASRNADVFFAALGGGGQIGVITKATLTLVPDERGENKDLASYVLTFRDEEAFLDAILDPTIGDVFYEVQGNARPDRRGWEYLIKGSADLRVVSSNELRGRFPRARVQRKIHAVVRSGRHGVLQSALYDYGLKLIRRWDTPHPWATMFLPIETTKEFFSTQLKTVHRAGLGRLGFVTLVPTKHYRRPYSFLQLPPGERYGSFGIFYMPSDEASARPLFEHLVDVQREADAVDGKSYLSDAIPTTADLWRRYYGAQVDAVVSMKRKHDPNLILKTLHPSQDSLFGVRPE